MLTLAQIDTVLRVALLEDAPWGDPSSTLVPNDRMATARLVAREPGIFAGGGIFIRAFELPELRLVTPLHNAAPITVTHLYEEGQPFEAGTLLAEVSGSAQILLGAERVALNLVQRLSGIATLTHQYVKAVATTSVRIVDTRKTTPGLRILERYAVRTGGGHNHRFSLSDAVMIKDNHLVALGARSEEEVTDALLELRERLPHTTHIEVEIDSLAQLDAVLNAQVDTIMLDNFSLDDLREGVERIGGRTLVEASGGVNLKTVSAIAETGVNIISVGALTHSARALDLGLDFWVNDHGSGPSNE